jgi:transcriptional regulator with XRE-family HTH domain
MGGRTMSARTTTARKTKRPGRPSASGQSVTELEIGARLHEWRRRRRLTLREVADAANISESFLSQVERNGANMSIATLCRVAAALDCTVADLFDPRAGEPALLRKSERPRMHFDEFGTKFFLTPRPYMDIEACIADIDPGGSTGPEPYTHGDSEELLLVLSGSIVAQVDSHEVVLETGDSLRYRSSSPHRLYNPTDERAEVLWVTSPPG